MGKFEILIQDIITKKIFDVQDIIIKPKIEQKLNNGCSKLTFDIVIDNNAVFQNGSIMRFKYNNTGMFYRIYFQKTEKRRWNNECYSL